MIVREIIDSPFSIIAKFDYFNDWSDTNRWLETHSEAKKYYPIRAHLKTGHALWLAERNRAITDAKKQT